jgi:hypothetical protein
MSDKPVTWSQGIAVVGGAFGLCCLGFMVLHGMVISDRAEAAANLKSTVIERNQRFDRIADLFEAYRQANDRDHKEIMMMLGKLIQKP